MACCGGGAPSFAAKREALERTPFFAAAAKASSSDSSTLLDRLAEEAELRKVKPGTGLDDVAFGTFVVVVEGELQHTEKRIGGPRQSAAAVAVDRPDAMATRTAGDIFRMAGLGLESSQKLQKMGGAELSRVVAVQRSVLLLITKAALGAALQGVDAVALANDLLVVSAG